jgi:hypothetical protein
LSIFKNNYLLEKRLHKEFTCHEIISELREMNFKEIKGEGYEPIYTRTDFTDALHEAFGFHTDYQIVTTRMMKKIFKGIIHHCPMINNKLYILFSALIMFIWY